MKQSRRFVPVWKHGWRRVGATAFFCTAINAQAAPGCIVDPGNVSFGANATLDIEIGGLTPCTGYDRFTVQQHLTLNGAKLRVTIINGFALAAGQSFDVLDWGTLSGTFASVTFVNDNLPSEIIWNLDALYSTGTLSLQNSGHSAPTKVPIPPWAIGGMALGLFALARRAWNGHQRRSTSSG